VHLEELIAMAPKLFVTEYQTSAYDAMHGKQLFVDSIGGEEFSAANDCIKLFGHIDLGSLQFDPGGFLSGRISF